MRVRTCVIACCAVVLLGAVATPRAAAVPLDKRTTFTFSAPFTVPGVTLPAGSYTFRIANTLHGRDVVQVLGADSGTAYAMFFTLRTPRGEPVDHPELRFMETAPDVPMAIKTWWYPADTQGYEFLYPREQARLLRAGAGTPMLTTEPAAVEAPEVETVVSEPLDAETPVVTEEPVLVGEVAEAVEETPPFEAQEPSPAALPKTGSPTATLLLLGAFALIAAIGIRTARTVRT